MQFNTFAPDWQQCMDKCWRYNRAQAPSYSNQEELDELLSWGNDATIDPISGKDYPDTSKKQDFFVKVLSFTIFVSVIETLRECGKIIILIKSLTLVLVWWE